MDMERVLASIQKAAYQKTSLADKIITILVALVVVEAAIMVGVTFTGFFLAIIQAVT